MDSADLVKQVKHTIDRHHLLAADDAVVIGVSGGPDSLCLLHALLCLRDSHGLRLHVAHLNHGLRGAEADADAAFVSDLAKQWSLPATVEKCDVAAWAKQRRLAIEEAARQARYAFLARVARHVGATKIAVGHNADDQVETICMHWLRGSGLAGLRGMQPMAQISELRLGDEEMELGTQGGGLLLIRPLLEVPRATIEAYCAEHGLQPRFDRSNLDTTLYRNRLRHELLPFLETFNPNIRQVLLRSARIFAADYDYLRRAAAEAWSDVVIREDSDAIIFSLAKWRELHLSLKRSVLRQAIHRLRRSLRNINWVHVENALQVLQNGTTGMVVTLPCGLETRLGYDRFIVANQGYVEPLPDMPWLCREVSLRIPGQTPLPGCDWVVTARVVARQELLESVFEQVLPWRGYLDYEVTGSALCLRPRREGDRFWPQGLGDKPTTVNGFMTNAKIPRAWRDGIPLLVSPRQVLWLVGWRIDERAKVTPNTRWILVLELAKTAEHADSPRDAGAGRPETAAGPETSGGQRSLLLS